MNQDFMDPEIFADFIVEAKEHLETIEPNLLELEKNPENLSLLNDIFRPMHSLKGASGFLGLNIINALAHKSESVLDELRKGSFPVTNAIMDVILSSTDTLSTLIDNLESQGSEGDVDTSDLLAALDGILAQQGQTADSPKSEPQNAEEEASPLVDNEPEPEPVYDLEPVDDAEQPPDDEPEPQEASEEEPPAPPEDFDASPYPLTAIGEGHLSDFLEEAHEIVGNLNSSLLELEKHPDQDAELVNDTFRYFHNLKGNSGIIGYKELNGLTHEAETLLNKIRHGELTCTHAIIDVLLSSVDFIEKMLDQIDQTAASVTPLDISHLVHKLQRATEEPEDLQPDEQPAPPPESEAAAPEPEPAPEATQDEAASDNAEEFDEEDIAIFEQTVGQQIENITLALETLQKDPEQKDYVDGLFRSLTTIQNSTGYMGMAEVKVYAERTAGLVDQARKSGVGFELMLELLRQECSILEDMVRKELAKLKNEPEQPAAPEQAAEPAPADKPEPAPVAESAAASNPEPASEATPEPEPAPAVESEPTPEPKPEAKPKSTPKPEPAAKPRPAAQPAPKPASQPAPRPAQRAEAKAAPRPAPKPAPRPAQRAAPPKPPAGANGPQADANAIKHKGASTIRVDHQKLDHLMNLIGELIINRNRYTMLARALEDDASDISDVAQQLTETTYAMTRISDDLQDTIMKVRMVPVQSVFSRFPRLVRDLSRKSGKRVELITEGEETELDKSVVEEIGDPLVHLIRNSVDHGLEPEEERIAAGKSPVGNVWLRAYHKGNSVAIEVEDDGRGIDPEKIRNVAVKKGVIGADDARNLDDREAVDLIFAPGFSSAEKVTDISGRGVGMDVVRNNIKNLKGTVNVSTEVGKGSKFTLTLPLTLAIIDALMVQVAGDNFAIPLDAVSETTKIEASKLTDVNNRKAVTLRGEVLGIVELAELLGMPTSMAEKEILPVVVIHDNDRRLGIVVDRLLERQDIVIKPLGAYLSEFDMRGLSGATIMGDGSVVLILDPHEIYVEATSGGKINPPSGR
jgi:two-component system chemotaxis sensor kinase CheA